MRFLLMTADKAETLRAYKGESRLDPRMIEAGEHKGMYAVPARVKADRAHADKLAVLERLTETELDIDAAWPAPIEE
jgi:hypothetical protein